VPSLRRLLLVLVLALAAPATASAQIYSVNASAVVTSAVSMTSLTDLTFASPVIPGVTATVSPTNGGRAQLTYNEMATVMIPASLMLTGPAGAQLRVDLTCAESTVSNSATPTAFPSGCTSGLTVTVSGNVGGTRFVYVGGTVSNFSSTSAVAGNYSGSFPVTASYVTY
jgi:hypothetical protein